MEITSAGEAFWNINQIKFDMQNTLEHIDPHIKTKYRRKVEAMQTFTDELEDLLLKHEATFYQWE